MSGQNMIDLKAMQARVDEEDKARAEQFRASMRAITEREERNQAELNELFGKAIQSEREEAERRRAKEIEAAKEKALREVEDRYEGQGIKSESTLKKDEAYRSLLKGI